MPLSKPHLSMLDTTTQAIAVAGTPQVVTFNTTLINDKIVVTSSSRFTVNEGSQYRVSISSQATSSVANKILDIWVRVNGTDVPNSNTKVNVVNNEVKKISTALPITVTAGQYFEIWVSGDSTGLSLVSYPTGVTPTRPVVPSITVIIERIHPY